MWPPFDRCSNVVRYEETSEVVATTGEIENIPTIAGSLGSIGTLSQVTFRNSH